MTKRLALFAIPILLSVQPVCAKEATYKMRWLVAHGPIEVVDAGVQAFAKEVEQKTNGDIKVIRDDSGFQSGEPTTERNDKALSDIREGKSEMGQIYASVLVKLNKNFGIFDVPFLIRDHKHASLVFDGKPGQQLLSSLSEFGLQGAAFTYSGGFRVIVSKQKDALNSTSAFKGKKISYIGPLNYQVAETFYKQLDAKPVVLKKQRVVEALADQEIDAYETVYLRIKNLGEIKNADYAVNETFHNLQATVVVINADFFKKLPEKYRAIVLEAAKNASLTEREASIRAGEVAKTELQKKGSKIIKLSEAEQKAMQTDFSKSLPLFAKFFDAGFVQTVSNLK